MDIKDFILIGGGILIAAVVGHGFWIAWRAKREPLRLDIVPDLIPDDVDEIERLRGELPNGGARIRRRPDTPPENLELDLAAPVLMDPAQEPTPAPQESQPEPAPTNKVRPNIRQAPPRAPQTEVVEPELTTAADDAAQSHVREVELAAEPIVSEPPAGKRKLHGRKREDKPAAPAVPEAAPVEELLIVNVLAPRGERFDGEGLVNALRGQGLRYGDMNIFHRVDPATKAKLYSVANAVEPGTFDLADLADLRSPGMTFFLQLPGPDDAIEVFNDMMQAARNVALELGGDLRDEELSVLTGQSTEHMRQRIADFARRRLSKRA